MIKGRTPRLSLLAAAVLLFGIALPAGVSAQARGGPPMGLPAGLPGRGLPGDLPGGVLGHGPPPWAIERAAEAGAELDHIRGNATEHLSLPQQQRAVVLQRADPALYELDRAGALVMRGEVLSTGLDQPALDRLVEAGFTLERLEDLPDLDLHLAVISRAGLSASDLLKLLHKTEPKGAYALNHVLFGSGGLERAGAKSAVAVPDTSDRPIRVGLVDTGVSPRLQSPPRLQLVQKAFQPGAERPGLHGTAVAALLAARPGPVTLYAAAIFSDTRGGSSDLLVSALGWLAAERVPVINISMVGPANPIVAVAIAALVRKGFTVVAPVGNDGAAARPLYPASYPGVVAVSAASGEGRLLPEASRVKRVDFVAPGTARVPDPAGGETTVRGTSFAAPVVSRLLAERIAAPDPAAARAGIAALTRATKASPNARRWSGPGLLVGP